jgi:hypothetical protein
MLSVNYLCPYAEYCYTERHYFEYHCVECHYAAVVSTNTGKTNVLNKYHWMHLS